MDSNNNNSRSGEVKKNRNFKGKKKPFKKSGHLNNGRSSFKHHQSPFLEPKEMPISEANGNLIPKERDISEINGNFIPEDNIPNVDGNREQRPGQSNRHPANRSNRNRRPKRSNPSNANRSDNYSSSNRPENKNRSQRSNNRNSSSRNKKAATVPDGPETPSNKKITGVEGVYIKYDEYLQIILENRKNYFEYYSKVRDNEKRKLEKNYFQALENLKKWIRSLAPWQKEFLEKKINPYPEDKSYSENHTIEPLDISINSASIVDPHFTKFQQEAKERYKDDCEESIGTIDDYKKYKNL